MRRKTRERENSKLKLNWEKIVRHTTLWHAGWLIHTLLLVYVINNLVSININVEKKNQTTFFFCFTMKSLSFTSRELRVCVCVCWNFRYISLLHKHTQTCSCGDMKRFLNFFCLQLEYVPYVQCSSNTSKLFM